MNSIAIHDLGVVGYGDAFRLQQDAVRRLHSNVGEEHLFLLEHRHVLTLGRNASRTSLVASTDLLQRRGVELVETDRGGDVTYHGPGQLVGYPILRLEEGRRDIRRFVDDVEEALLRTLAHFGISGRRDPVHRGVWVENRKIASVGIRIARWVTSHGFALNVDTDLSYFDLIHPCGIQGCEMTSMTREMGSVVPMTDVKHTFVDVFSTLFDRAPAWSPTVEEVEHHG